jgi:hypothetical protein
MKSFTICAFLSFSVLAAMSVGCAAPDPDQDDALDEGQASEEAIQSTEQPIEISPLPPTCDNLRIPQSKFSSCLGGPSVICTRECIGDGHWSFLLQKCVVDTLTCENWSCPPCN